VFQNIMIENLQIWTAAVDLLNKQSRTTDKGLQQWGKACFWQKSSQV